LFAVFYVGNEVVGDVQVTKLSAVLKTFDFSDFVVTQVKVNEFCKAS